MLSSTPRVGKCNNAINVDHVATVVVTSSSSEFELDQDNKMEWDEANYKPFPVVPGSMDVYTKTTQYLAHNRNPDARVALIPIGRAHVEQVGRTVAAGCPGDTCAVSAAKPHHSRHQCTTAASLHTLDGGQALKIEMSDFGCNSGIGLEWQVHARYGLDNSEESHPQA